MSSEQQWKIHKSENGREILTRLFYVSDLAAAQEISAKIINLQKKKNYPENELQLSLSVNGVLVILHGVSDGSVRRSDHDFAQLITNTLNHSS